MSVILFKFIKNGNLISFAGYFIGAFSILVFLIHCGFFSKRKFAHRDNIEFIKEFVFLNGNKSSKYVIMVILYCLALFVFFYVIVVDNNALNGKSVWL
ncbi:hypothetical protein EAE91_12055 [Photorhabdus noenieputensis]|uniref:hypothetical protein n=1 Tax=Photorhabdus noenieputensis TaxID=1208607 RepID=UPI001BD42BFF|nr:hypothetical protein [Photorhabdus noenieputensis]MBS9437874.1 hypothetical protein [Photorhabdus noenieputensis]MCK3668322.1 hypothetical protein [Photorhabdus noenieputensis]